MRLAEISAVVTGGASGLGAATCRALAHLGVTVTVCRHGGRGSGRPNG